MRLLSITILSAAAAAAQSVQPADLLNAEVPAADHRLSYGANALHFGELRIPKTKGPHPVAILIHGGCWAERLPRFDPRATSFELLRPLAAALTDAGLATWNVEYRRNGSPGGGWPGTFEDLSRATDFLRTIAIEHGLDLKRVVAVGHSSGGQLAMWLPARSKLPDSSPLYSKDPLALKGVVNLDGPADLETMQGSEQKVCGFPAISQFMGGTPAEHPQRYREGSATAFLPLGVILEFIGGGLLQRSPELASAYEAAAESKGDRVTITVLPKSGHFDMLSPRSPHWSVVLERIQSTIQ